MTEYERKRRSNILRNQAYLEQVGVSAAKLAARTAVTLEDSHDKSKKESAPKRARLRPEPPARKSRRLQGKKVPSTGGPQFVWKEQRTSNGDVIHVLSKTKKTLQNTKFPICTSKKIHNMSQASKAFLQEIVRDDKRGKDTASRRNDDVEYSLATEDVVKVCEGQIHALAFYPSVERIVVACGDNQGNVAFWSSSSGQIQSLAAYRPHKATVSQLIFPDSSNLISSSYDGTVQKFDMRAMESSVVYTPSSRGRVISLVASITANCYYTSWDDGTVRRIDQRAGLVQNTRHQLHKLQVNTVHQHPSLDSYIATASLDRTVSLWDVRKLSSDTNKAVATIPYSRSVNCAYFSPQEGKWLVTVDQDSSIHLLDVSSLTVGNGFDANTTCVRRCSKLNLAITRLQATWDPKRPDQFAIGCIKQRKRTQIFRAGTYQPLHELVSDKFDCIHSASVFHPHLDLIAGCSGDASGKMALWRGKTTDQDAEA